MSDHPQHRAHPNSGRAYEEVLPNLNSRAGMIASLFRRGGEYTDREVMVALGFTDMNQVRPTITKLIDCEALEESGNVMCPITGKRVRKVRLSTITRKNIVANQPQGDLFLGHGESV